MGEKKKSQNWIERVKSFVNDSPEIKFAFTLFVIVALFLLVLSIIKVTTYKGDFLGNVLAEIHGLAFDILVFGILIVIFNKLVEKRRDIKRWQEEIDDFKGWNEKEATYRIVGNIKRLNRYLKTDIDLSYCHLENARLGRDPQNLVDMTEANLSIEDIAKMKEGYLVISQQAKKKEIVANLKGAKLIQTNLFGAHLIDIDLRGANLYRANLQGAYLYWAKLQKTNLRRANLQYSFLRGAELEGASLMEANLRGARYLIPEQLANVETLYKANLDPELEQQIREKYPHLLEKPKEKE